MGDYSAACRADFAKSSSISAARSRKPGLPGESGRKMALSMPRASTSCRNSARRFRNSTTLIVSPSKSSVLTDHARSSAVGVRASPSSSIRGVYLRRAIVPYLTLVRFSQRDDAKTRVAFGEHADVQTPVKAGVTDKPHFTKCLAQVDDDNPQRPIQPYRVGQRQPVLGAVGGILRNVPLKLHAAKVTRGVVKQLLPEGMA
jgi:hypothetical protein